MALSEKQSRELDQLYERYNAEVFRTCLKFSGGRRDWALDRMQDTFVRVANELHRLNGVHNVGGWLYTIAVRECLMSLRRERIGRRVRKMLKPRWRSTTKATERVARARRDLSVFARALAGFPPRERALLILVYVENKQQREAAEILGISNGQVSKLLKRSLQRLRQFDWEIADVT